MKRRKSMNKSVLIGRLTRNLDLKYSANSMAILKLNLAVNRRKKGETDFINCIAFDKTAENIAKYFEKGSQIAIIGHIQTGSYKDKDDKTIYTTDVIIDEFDFVGNKKSENQPSDAKQDNDGFYPIDEDDSDSLPF
jgi:single-strand DNA-binding protein